MDPSQYLERFGLEQFRPGQREVIETIGAGRDTLCTMPTGGGKSLCYQLPALMLDGVTFVVSPLIALMKDQVDALTRLDIPATYINSSLTAGEQHERLRDIERGAYKLVYLAPERMRNQRFRDAVRSLPVALLAIDEAHCISEWGHDFRPDYARLSRFRELLQNPTTVALTATATPMVRDDIVAQLSLKDPAVFVSGFARPNLAFQVEWARSQREKDEYLLRLFRAPGCGIVYASTRKSCEMVAETLAYGVKPRRRVGMYHAGLAPDERRSVQEAFMAGELDIIVATNAFGMGIDKADVRYVVHYNMPGSLEAYYQEAGRAGRDGQPSRCVLLFSPTDRYIHEFFIENAYPSRQVVRSVYEYLRTLDDDPIEITLDELKERLDLNVGSEGISTSEKLLEKCDAIKRLDSQQNQASVWIDTDVPTLVDLVPREATVQRKVMRAVEQMVGKRRHEQVSFHLERLAASTELDRAALLRALRELRKLRGFDFVAPFRGRAVHVRDRSVPFQSLEIDFRELARRKDAELEKLDRVVAYAGARSCRQLSLLEYFGDPDRKPCGMCDRCHPQGALASSPIELGSEVAEGTAGGTTAAHSEAVTEAARMVLSGVARSQGRFGKQVLVQMLWGSQAEKVTKWRLDQLSTFGILKHLNQAEIGDLVEAVIAARYVESIDVERFRPTLRLTEDGIDLMRSPDAMVRPLALPRRIQQKLERHFRKRSRTASKSRSTPASSSAPSSSAPSSSAPASSSAPPPESPGEAPADTPREAPAAVDPDTVAALKQWRRETAEQQNCAPFRILTNAVLQRIAQESPSNLEELQAVSGVGPHTAEHYGHALLQLVNRPEEDFSEPDVPPPRPSASEFQEVSPSPSDQTAGATDHREEPEAEPRPSGSTPAGLPESSSVPPSSRTSPTSAESNLATNEVKPNYYWSWRLLQDGFSLQECVQIRRLDEKTVLEHALQAREAGLPVEMTWFLDARQLQELSAAVQNSPDVPVRTLLAELPFTVRYEHVELLRKCLVPS